MTKIQGTITIATAITITSAIIGVMLGLFGYNASANKDTNQQVQTVRTDIQIKGERLASVESSVGGIDKRLSKVEEKVDRVLETQAEILGILKKK